MPLYLTPNSAGYQPTGYQPKGTVDISNPPKGGTGVPKKETTSSQIESLQRQIDELRGEITVLKTLLPPEKYIYSISNTVDK